jgi:hypothetical protein
MVTELYNWLLWELIGVIKYTLDKNSSWTLGIFRPANCYGMSVFCTEMHPKIRRYRRALNNTDVSTWRTKI